MWFDEAIVTRKREEISLLIKNLMENYDIDTSILPDLPLPTLNGKKHEDYSFYTSNFYFSFQEKF